MRSHERYRWAGRPELVLLLTLAHTQVSADDIADCRVLLQEHRDSFDWGLFIDQASRHKVLPLIGRNMAVHRLHHSTDGVPLVPYRWLFESVYYANRRRNEELAREFGKVFTALNSAGLPYAVRKGPVITESLYPDPGMRRMYDLDILVEREDARHIGRALSACGYEQGRLSEDGTAVEPFTRKTQAFWRLHVNNELPFIKPSLDPAVDVFSIDLCLDLFQKHARGNLTTAEVLGRRIPATLCDSASFALSPADQFVDLCLHLRKEATARYYMAAGVDLQISKFLDVALSCARLTATDQWKRVMTHARSTGTAESVYYAMFYTRFLYPEAVPEEQLAALGVEDLGFLEEYGAVDGKVGRWEKSFPERLFARERKSAAQGASAVPRV